MQPTTLCAFAVSIACAVLGRAGLAQEILGVNFAGQAFAVSSTTGQGRLIGPTGVAGCNAMAKESGVLYSVSSVGLGQRNLVSIDRVTAQATILFPLSIDVRGLAPAGSGQLFAIANGTTDVLHAIDTATGQVTTVGSTGFASIQALTERQGLLYAWDNAAGLLLVDPATGAATDPFPGIDAQGQDVQFLAVANSAGRLVGGRNTLFEVNVNTGALTTIGASGFSDLRGAELHTGRVTHLGTGCDTPNGASATVFPFVTSSNPLLAGTTMTLFSQFHQPNAIGLLVVGLSDTVHQGVPLPLNLDPLLGTAGCSLFVSADATSLAVGNNQGQFLPSFPLPNVFGGVLFFQLASLENVPGGFVFSNGLKVEMPF